MVALEERVRLHVSEKIERVAAGGNAEVARTGDENSSDLMNEKKPLIAWVATVPPDKAGGNLAREYDAALERAGRISNVLRISSLNPRTLATWVKLYRDVMFAESPLTRVERELIAVVVSQVNGCHY